MDEITRVYCENHKAYPLWARDSFPVCYLGWYIQLPPCFMELLCLPDRRFTDLWIIHVLAVTTNKVHTSCSLFRVETVAIRHYYFIRKATLGDSSYGSYGVQSLHYHYIFYLNYTVFVTWSCKLCSGEQRKQANWLLYHNSENKIKFQLNNNNSPIQITGKLRKWDKISDQYNIVSC